MRGRRGGDGGAARDAGRGMADEGREGGYSWAQTLNRGESSWTKTEELRERERRAKTTGSRRTTSRSRGPPRVRVALPPHLGLFPARDGSHDLSCTWTRSRTRARTGRPTRAVAKCRNSGTRRSDRSRRDSARRRHKASMPVQARQGGDVEVRTKPSRPHPVARSSAPLLLLPPRTSRPPSLPCSSMRHQLGPPALLLVPHRLPPALARPHAVARPDPRRLVVAHGALRPARPLGALALGGARRSLDRRVGRRWRGCGCGGRAVGRRGGRGELAGVPRAAGREGELARGRAGALLVDLTLQLRARSAKGWHSGASGSCRKGARSCDRSSGRP